MLHGSAPRRKSTHLTARTITVLVFFVSFFLAPSALSINWTIYHWSNVENHNLEAHGYEHIFVDKDAMTVCLQVANWARLNADYKEWIGNERLQEINPGYVKAIHCLYDFINNNGLLTTATPPLYRHGISCPSGSIYNLSSRQCECTGGGSFSLEAPYCAQNSEENAGESCPSQTGGTNPVNLGVGNKYQTEIDYIGNGAFPLTVRRTYNYITARWQFFSELIINADQTQIQVVRPDGKKLEFTSDAAGNWVGPPYVTGTLTKIVDGSGNVIGWRYKTLEGDTEDYGVDGRILKITNPQGIRHTYSWNTASIYVNRSLGGRLIYNTTSLPGTVLFYVTSFVDPNTNETITYTRNDSNLITGINYPNGGGTRTYHYENTAFPGALTGITDANGDRFATWTYDAQGRAISSEHFGGAEKVTLDYTYLNDPTDPRTTATNALGKQTTYHFTTLYGVRKVTQVEGHPSANCAAANKNYTYDANGFMASKTDWKGNTTTYVRNSKGQELSRTEATGTPQARTITTEWHPTFNLRTKVTEPDRETTYTYDVSGNLLNDQIVDLAEP